DERQRVAIRNTQGIGRIERCHHATLAEIRGRVSYSAVDGRHRQTTNFRGSRIGLAELLGRTHTIVVFGEMLPYKIRLNVRIRLEPNTHTPGPQVTAVDRLVGQLVEAISIALSPFAGYADIEPVIDDRQVKHAFEATVLVVTDVG